MESDYPPNCREPEQGRALAAFLEGSLSPEERDAFESHYFDCPACLEMIQVDQAMTEVLGKESPAVQPSGTLRAGKGKAEGGNTSRSWLAYAGALAAVLVAGFFLAPSLLDFQSPDTSPPFELKLAGPYRAGEAPSDLAPSGRPLELSLFVPVPANRTLTYDVTIRGPEQDTVYQENDIMPTSLSELRVLIQHGFEVPGVYTVRLTEPALSPEAPVVFTYSFRLAP